MPRPKAFDPDAVVGAALELFWTRGYQATSFDDITRATGVNKPSLYAEFGDKSGLFARVLERYHEMLLAHASAMLGGQGNVRDAIRAWLLSFLPSCSGAAGGRGCLSVNATLDAAAAADPAAARRVADFRRTIERLLTRVIRRGVASGELSRAVDPQAAARLLLVAQTGLMVHARELPSPAATRKTMLQALRVLDA
jgi:TetR/AcrR family transcriptional repressor of nem operon